MRAAAPPLPALFLLLAALTPLGAQEPAVLQGVVLDAETGEAVSGAVVRPRFQGGGGVEDPGGFATDARGRFVVRAMTPGLHEIEVEHLAYGIRTDTLSLRPGEVVEIQFLVSARPIEIAGIEVTARSTAVEADLARGTRSDGMTAAEVDRVRDRTTTLSDLLRAGSVPGMFVNDRPGGACIETTRHRARSPNDCNMVGVAIDGVLAADPAAAIAGLNPNDVERWELLSSLEAGTRYGAAGGYGVLEIYTRGGRQASAGSGDVGPSWTLSAAFVSTGPSTLHDGLVKVDHSRGTSGLAYSEKTSRSPGFEVSAQWNTRSVGFVGLHLYVTGGASTATYSTDPGPTVVERDISTVGADVTLTIPFFGTRSWGGLLGFGPSFAWRRMTLNGHPDQFADPPNATPPSVTWSNRSWFSPGGLVSMDVTRYLGRSGGAYAGLVFRGLFGGGGEAWARSEEQDILDSTGNQVTVTYVSSVATSLSFRAGVRWYP